MKQKYGTDCDSDSDGGSDATDGGLEPEPEPEVAQPHVKSRYRVDDGGGAAFRLSPVMSDRSDVAADAGMVIEVVDSKVNADTGETWVQHTYE